MKKAVCLIVLALAFSMPAFATTYWVGKGSMGSPSCATASGATDPGAANRRLTIALGIACLSGGDTLIIGNGTYVERVINTIPSGSMGAPTTIQAENRNQAILRPDNSTYTILSTQNPNQYITINGLYLDGINTLPSDGVECFPGTCDHIIIENGTVANTQGSGISGQYTNSLFFNMDIVDCGAFDQYQHGIYISNNNNVVDGSRVTRVAGGYGIHIYHTNGSSDNNIVRNNVITDANQGAVLASRSAAQIYNNIITGSTTNHGVLVYSDGAVNTKIWNNTFYNLAEDCIDVDASGGVPSFTLIQNNICYQTGAIINDNGSSTTCNHNLGVTNDTTSGTCSGASGTNPQFTNAAAGQFTLTASSLAAIAKGVDLSGNFSTDFTGTTRTAPWDVGAYKYVSAAPPGTPPIDDLSGYTIATALAGKNGGSADWTGPYTQAGASDFTIAAKPSEFPSGQAAEVVNTSGTPNAIDTRAFTAIVAGPVPVRLKTTSTSPSSGSLFVGLKDTLGNDVMNFRFSGGNCQLWDGALGGYSTIAACASGYHKIVFLFDTSAHPNQYAVQIDNGTTSSYKEVVTHTYSSISGIELVDTDPDAHTFDVGAIGINPDYAVFTTQPTTVVSGLGMSPSPIVTVRAPGGATDTTFTGNVTLTISACGASISSGGTVAASAGVVTFNSLILSTAASGCTFTAAATNVDTSVASSSFNVTAAGPGTSSGVNRRRRR